MQLLNHLIPAVDMQYYIVLFCRASYVEHGFADSVDKFCLFGISQSVEYFFSFPATVHKTTLLKKLQMM